MNTALKKILILMLAFSTTKLHAKPFTPADPDTVIAHWPARENRTAPETRDPLAALAQANHYLSQANQPGESRLYGLAQASLQPLMTEDTSNTDLWLTWAQIQQHQHQFNEAQRALGHVIKSDPHNITANLLSARIFVIQGNQPLARQSCLRLLGYSDLLTASACVLEVISQSPEKLTQSYEQLQQLINREGMPQDERGPWLAQLLADMSMRLGNSKAAAQWLEPYLLNASLNLLAQWAQTQLIQGNYQLLFDRLVPVLDSTTEPDDALLLPVAIAEKHLKHSTQWQTLLDERIALREQRQDTQHANELARYFLDVNLQPKKALHWAQIHYENSREASDKQLLERALIAASSTKPEVL